jgi:ligand-binding SRPBCC domain-containing protein
LLPETHPGMLKATTLKNIEHISPYFALFQKHILNTLIAKQKLPISLQTAWDFLSDPENLKTITPKSMGFEITSENIGQGMYPGMIITYKVRPMLNIPVKWVTEITQVHEGKYFIDNQKSGPYRFWHHQHFIKEIEGGVEMTDIVNYAAPFGLIGLIVEKLFINKKVRGIFEYRETILFELFGKYLHK